MKSLQGNLRPRSTHQGRGLRFPCNDRTDKVNKLFIIWLFHYGPEPAINKTNNCPADNLKKTRHLNEWLTLEPAIKSGDTGQPYPNPNCPPTHTHPATSSLQLQDYKSMILVHCQFK